MPAVTVKWGKETLNLDVDLSAPVADLHAAIERATGVPVGRQKLSSAKGAVKADTDLTKLGLESGKPLMLIGTAEAAPQKPKEPIVFREDEPGLAPDEATSNGLVNVGNTCYLNSVLQLLRAVPELRPALAQSGNPVAKELAVLYDTLDNSRDAAVPHRFWATFMLAFPTFARTDDRGFPMQHDAQEALTSILQSAGQLTTADLFQGRTVDTNGAEEPFTMISCSITADVHILESGIMRNFSDETGATSRRLSKLPPYLLVHMIRFAWRADTKENAKVLRPVAFPLVLDVQPFCTDALKSELEEPRSLARARRDAAERLSRKAKQKPNAEDVTPEAVSATESLPPGPDNISGYYQLAAVISHKGRTLDGGHYVAWVKKRGVWLLHDDNHVAPVSNEDILRLRGVGEAHIAYVLLYRCRDDAGHAPYPT